MSERAKELGEQFLRYLKEAGAEWGESFRDSPEAHCYSLAAGALIAQVIGWLL